MKAIEVGNTNMSNESFAMKLFERTPGIEIIDIVEFNKGNETTKFIVAILERIPSESVTFLFGLIMNGISSYLVQIDHTYSELI